MRSSTKPTGAACSLWEISSWHTDSSFKQTPASYSLLHAHAAPPEDGETQFVDMRVAWETLPPKLQARIQDLSAEHSICCSRAKLGFTDFTEAERAATPPCTDPWCGFIPGRAERRCISRRTPRR